MGQDRNDYSTSVKQSFVPHTGVHGQAATAKIERDAYGKDIRTAHFKFGHDSQKPQTQGCDNSTNQFEPMKQMQAPEPSIKLQMTSDVSGGRTSDRFQSTYQFGNRQQQQPHDKLGGPLSPNLSASGTLTPALKAANQRGTNFTQGRTFMPTVY